MKELMLWIYTGSVVGQRRVLLVADTTVGGAKARFNTSYGSPSGKNAIPASAPGFPAWVKEPGVWIGIAPTLPNSAGGIDPENRMFDSLDRYSQDVIPTVPKVLPDQEAAFLHGATTHEVQLRLEGLIRDLLREKHSTAFLKASSLPNQ